MDHQGKESRGRKVGWGSWVGVGFAGLVVGVVVVMMVSGFRAEGRIQAAQERLEAMGYSLDPADMNREVDPAVNGWEFGGSAFMGAQDWDVIGVWEFLTGSQHPMCSINAPGFLGMLDPTAVDSAAAIKKAGSGPYAPVIPMITRKDYELAADKAVKDAEVVSQALRMPEWVIVRDYSRPSMTLFPELAKAKVWSKVFSFWGREHFQRGEFEEGLRDFESSYLVGDRVANDRVMIASLVQIACYAITLDRLVMAVGDLSPEDRLLVIPRVRELILSHRKVDLVTGLQGEVIYALDAHLAIDGALAGMPWYVRYLPVDQKALMAYHWEAVAESSELMQRFEGDPMGVWKQLESLELQEYRGNPIEVEVANRAELGSALSSAAVAVVRIGVRDQMALLGLAIWEKEASTGVKVQGLDEVEGDLRDVFDPAGGAFQFRRERDGFVFWGYGRNRSDQGGVVDETSPLFRDDMYFQTALAGRQVLGGE